MSYIYRYIDKLDGEIKYVGIVWADGRTLEQRIREHALKDPWADDGVWEIQYIRFEGKSRTDLEALEAHLINQYGTGKYYNKDKADWGYGTNIRISEYDWHIWKEGEENAVFFKDLKAENDWLRQALSEADQEIKILKKKLQERIYG